jgi:hypothetical protein
MRHQTSKVVTYTVANSTSCKNLQYKCKYLLSFGTAYAKNDKSDVMARVVKRVATARGIQLMKPSHRVTFLLHSRSF